MSNVNAEIKWQGNDSAWFSTNASTVYPANIQIFHTDGRYKFTDGVTTLGALPFRGDGGTETQNLQDVTDNGANTTNQMQINGVNVATVNDIPSLSGYVDTAGLTTNTIPKATASDTIGDSSITDNGTTVTVNGSFYATTGASEIFVYGDTANITADGQTNTNIETNLTENILRHNLKNTFDAPANNFPQLTASQSVETDANKNLVSVTHYTESFAYTGSPFTLTVAPNYIFSIRTTSMVLDESDINDVTIVGTTLTVINPAFQSGETLYIKYKG